MNKKIISNSSLISLIKEELDKKERLILVIEGNSCSGKTTLADFLKEEFDASVIHLDDFYNPRDKNKIIDTTLNHDGNINYKRFKEEIISFLSKKELDYIKFDCSIQSYLPKKKIRLNKLIIIEGTYALNPLLGKYYDLSIFLSIDKDLQLARLKKRNKSNYLEFISLWVKLEENYYNYYNILDKVDYIITSK